VRSAFPLPPSVNKEAAPTREGDPFNRLPADLQVIRLWLDMRLWEQLGSGEVKPGLSAVVAERVPAGVGGDRRGRAGNRHSEGFL
jgi:hypothetical protein